MLGNGAAAPGAYVVVGLVLLLFSVGYAAMATKVTNTGAFFAFVGRGLGIIPGVGSAFTSLVAYIAIQLAIYGFFGALVSGEMNDKFGIDQPWWFWTLISWALVTGLSALSVDIGAKLLGVLMSLELLSLLVTACAVLFSGGQPGGHRPRGVVRPVQHLRRRPGQHRRDRARLRVRVVHRLRGDGDLRRGVQGPAPHRARARRTWPSSRSR